MSSPMTQSGANNPAILRMLLAGGTESDASQWESRLRDAGIATRLTWTDDLAQAREIVQQGNADFLLCGSGEDSVGNVLDSAVRDIRASRPDLPIVMLQGADNQRARASALALGANDVVASDDEEHLSLVVQREFANVCLARRLRQTRAALKEAEERCALLLASSRAAIAYVHEGMHIFANSAYLELFGFGDVDDTMGLPLVDLLDADSVQTLKAALKDIRDNSEDAEFEFTGHRTDGNAVRGHMTLGRAHYEGEACLQITVRTVEEAASESDASTPAAVELPTISDFFANVDTELSDADAHYVFAAEINGYDELQAQLGIRQAADYADELWRTVAEQLPCNHALAPHRRALVLRTDPVEDNATERAEALREQIEQLVLEVNERSIRSTISLFGERIEGSTEKALNAAYQRLLHANHSNECNLVDLPGKDIAEEVVEHGSEAEAILAKINQAIENQSFVLLYQPIISLRGDSDEHYEVFLRMLDDGDEMAPDEFLQTAIDNDVAAKIDRWVILQSIKMLSVHRSKGHNTRLTINVTSNSVRDPEFAQWLGVAIKAARLPSDAVIFQVTEQDATTYLRQTRAFCEALSAMHCRSSLGRFGLADNPFENLRHIPVDMVKLDGSYVENLDDADRKNQLTAAISKLQQAGKLTIVPMVESANVLSALWQAGANFIQGHYLQEPTTEMDYDFESDD